MAVLPTFAPAQAPDTIPELAVQGANAGQSWMDQTQDRQIKQAQEQRNQQAFQAKQQQVALLMPAIAAKANADTLAATNDAAAAAAQQQIRGQWQSMKPQVVQDIADIHDPAKLPKQPDGSPDWAAQYRQWEALQAKYSALSLLPEGKAYYGLIEEGKKNAFDLAVKHDTASLTLDRLKAMTDMKLDVQQQLDQFKAQLDAQYKPQIAQTEQLNTQRNQAFTGIAAQRDQLTQMGANVENLATDIQKEQQSGLGSGPLVGGTIGSVLRPTARQVASDIGSFAQDIMSKVKNVRSQQELRILLASKPGPDDPAEVQNTKVNRLRTIVNVLSQRNDFEEQAMRSDPNLTPDQANEAAAAKFPFPSDSASGPKASSSGGSAPSKFITGKTYRDANGNQATWNGTGWDPVSQ